jgi:hypothetical protein
VSFLGLEGFYRKFVQGFASIAAPLTACTSDKIQNLPAVWGPAQDQAFAALKALSDTPVLIPYTPGALEAAESAGIPQGVRRISLPALKR